MNILLLAGAGTSIELGVPGMQGMAEQFLEHAAQWNVEPDLAEKLLKNSNDVEILIESLDRICSAQEPLQLIGTDNDKLDRVTSLRSEVEWFVQHAAERVLPLEATLMWGSVFQSAKNHSLTIVTTNYDRAIELAANATPVVLDDGFTTFEQRETASWQGFGHRTGVKYIKLHGSTDWFEDENGPIKLRHPIPLFGKTTLHLSSGQELGSALVLPSREKLLTHQPYPRLTQAFLNAADECDLAVFVGSSLRDPHLRDAAQKTSQRVPVFIVTPDGFDYDIKGALLIREHASVFLMSTLPYALESEDPRSHLTSAAMRRHACQSGIIDLIKEVLDNTANAGNRCSALEKLDEDQITLNRNQLLKLLSDTNLAVVRYTLGLASISPYRDELLDVVRSGIHSGDDALKKDLELVEEMQSKS